jgi:hypothetical protein
VRLRVMTYNIVDGGEGPESAILEAALPDLESLQEIYSDQFLQSLAQTRGLNVVWGQSKLFAA